MTTKSDDAFEELDIRARPRKGQIVLPPKTRESVSDVEYIISVSKGGARSTPFVVGVVLVVVLVVSARRFR